MYTDNKNNCKNQFSVVTIGNFDGLHKGHIKLIQKVNSLKKKYNLLGVMLTFDVNTKLCTNLIFEKNTLKKAVKKLGIDEYFSLHFMDEVKNMTCDEFVRGYIVEKFNAKYVVVGDNFFFGRNKSGNALTLKRLGEKYGFETVIVPCIKQGENIVSSTYIRSLISQGKIKKANKLMYQPFSIEGTVRKGYGVGSTILDIPTANVKIDKCRIMPKKGVYKTTVILDKKEYKSVTNVGTAPTNPKKKIISETFILDFEGDIYNKKIKVIFEDYMREEKKFKNFESLKNQITKDIFKRREM